MAQQGVMQGNPYGAPRAAVGDTAEEFQDVRIFAVSGRIGRVRYIAYSIGLSLLIMFAAGILAAVAGPVGAAIAFIAYIAMIVIQIMLTIQRSHDFNMTGWFSLLALIPLVNFIFWFIPGTDGENNFGARTPPNSAGVIIAALIIPILFFVGIIAAVSIPAYQQYQERAKLQQKR